MASFISDSNESNDGEFLYLAGSILQIWAALLSTVSVVYSLYE